MFLVRRLLLKPNCNYLLSSSQRQFSSSSVILQQLNHKPMDLKHNRKFDKIIDTLPKSLQRYGHRLINAPLSHIISFLTLHELSAIIPFIGLWCFFHNYGFLPTDVPTWVLEKGSIAIEKMVSKCKLNILID